jgi:hypothetical protein
MVQYHPQCSDAFDCFIWFAITVDVAIEWKKQGKPFDQFVTQLLQTTAAPVLDLTAGREGLAEERYLPLRPSRNRSVSGLTGFAGVVNVNLAFHIRLCGCASESRSVT